MPDPTHDTLHELRRTGYFSDPDDGALDDMARQFGLEAALFTPISGRAVLLDAEDLADGGAGMAIQQIRMLLAARGIAIEAADAEHYDETTGTTQLAVDGENRALMNWAFSRQAPPADPAQIEHDPALRDFLWKSRAQGLALQIRPCEHGSPGIDLHLAYALGTRFLAHWGAGFDDGQVLFSVNFFNIVNRMLERRGFDERLYAWQPFTSGQSGVLLDAAWFDTLRKLNLTGRLRRIDDLD